MPRCEKCGYIRAAHNWCTSCGSKNPYPTRKWVVRGLIALAIVAVLAGSVALAQRMAADRLESEKAKAGSFSVPREQRSGIGGIR